MSIAASEVPLVGTAASFFDLYGCDGKRYRLDDFDNAPILLVMFICNHCPYVKHIREKMVELVADYQKKGIAAVGINANDENLYPDESIDQMIEDAWNFSYTFPYLIDDTQEVAKAYKAVCTPDFYVFDKERKLAYHGQMDDSRPGNNLRVTGNDLRAVLDTLLKGLPVLIEQKKSTGCSIKWKKGNEPDFN